MALFTLLATRAYADPIMPLGDWLTQAKDALITIAPCGAVLCGEISGVTAWRPDGSSPRDESGASVCHERIIRNMHLSDDGLLHGTITDPRDGDVYDAEMWIGEDGNLRLRGYVGIPVFGSTQIWTHFSGRRKPDCHFSAG